MRANIITAALSALTVVSTSQEALAVDPATAALVVEGVNIVTSALKKPQPDLTLAIVERNRTLLIGMNAKLDQMGENLIKLHAAVGDIPARVAEELDKERLYQQGVRATARGQSLLGYIQSYEADLTAYAGDETELTRVRREFLEVLQAIELDITNISNEISQEASVRNIDAITLAIAAHSHLSVLAELNVRFKHNVSRMEIEAGRYVDKLGIALSDDDDTLFRWTRSRFEAVAAQTEWDQLNREYGIPKVTWAGIGDLPFKDLAGQSYNICIKRTSTKREVEYRPPIPNAGEPAHNSDFTTILATDYFLRTINFAGGPGTPLEARITTVATDDDCSADHPLREVTTQVEYIYQQLGRMLEPISTDRRTNPPEDCFAACGLGNDQNALSAAQRQLYVLEPSTQILALVADVQAGARMAQSGDLSAFQVSETLESLSIYKAVIQDQIDAQVRSDQAADIAALEADRVRLAGEVSALIERQDTELAALFKEAAEAAEFNKTLSYINLAAKVYHGWTKLDAKLSKGEKSKTEETLEAAIAGLSTAVAREPAGVGGVINVLVRRLDDIKSIADHYGDLELARRAQIKWDQVYTEAQNSIPEGASQTYDFYISNKDPFQFAFIVPAGDDVLMRPNQSFLKRITIEGKGRGPGHSLSHHIEVLGL